MGTDNLFHKRKGMPMSKIARGRSKRAPYEKVLIVCEGKKTEPNYFNGLIRHYRIKSVKITITGDGGSSPRSVVEDAENRYEKENKQSEAFDKVFCVFDKDNHTTYQAALNKLCSMKPPNTFTAITSVPAFEYWFLLHYEYSTRPYTSAQVLSDLKKYLSGYKKSYENTFSILKDNLDTAKSHAVRALQEARRAGTDNPSTKVHELVEFLKNIKS